jgi:uncharacterized membrane protein YecN with MAPEG domain
MYPNKKPYVVEFKRVGELKDEKCFMICICGAQIQIESFRHSWSIIETRVRWERHLEDAHKPA